MNFLKSKINSAHQDNEFKYLIDTFEEEMSITLDAHTINSLKEELSPDITDTQEVCPERLESLNMNQEPTQSQGKLPE